MTLFAPGGYFPPESDWKRLSKYKRMKSYFDGEQKQRYTRVSELLAKSPQASQLEKLYVAMNLPYILSLKPADLLVGDPPTFDSGKADDSNEQKMLNRIVEENDLVTLTHESATGGAYRGDSFFVTRFGYKHDQSDLERYGLPVKATKQAVIEHAAADCVFPETATRNVKRIKAYNVTSLDLIPDEPLPEGVTGPEPLRKAYLNVERHIPGYILYERFLLESAGTVGKYGATLPIWRIVRSVPTGRDVDYVETGADYPLVFHAPYSSTDDRWEGKGFVETIEHALQALEDRFTQLDYILLKHSDPILYGPELEAAREGTTSVSVGGKYIPITKDDATPGAITWDGKLEAVFKEIDYLLSYIFQMSETPQWLFGTTISGGGNVGGTGTSHTDGVAIKARFMPILSKVKRIRAGYDRALRDAIWACFQLEKEFGNYEGEAIYPKVHWKDGIPKNDKEEAEIAAIRTGDRPTLDQQTAIKRLDGVDDTQANTILTAIEADERRQQPTDPNVFNLEE